MSYENLKVITGTLKNASKPSLLERLGEKLVSPAQVYVTKVDIEKLTGGEVQLEIYGIVPQNYVGDHITVKQSSYSLGETNLCLTMQEVYSGSNEILNQPVVFRK
jgi:hypothetical protein